MSAPPITNSVIIDALKNINITPVSEIGYLNAGINIEKYEHILSFHCQFFIKHEEAQNLPGSLSLFNNQADFRVFFTDDRITCFLYVIPQTSTKPTQLLPVEDLLTKITVIEKTSRTLPHRHRHPRYSHIHSYSNKPQYYIYILSNNGRNHRRLSDQLNSPTSMPLSDTSSLVTLSSPLRNTAKKAKVSRSRSNSSSKIADKLSMGVKPVEDLFSKDPFISLCQFKYVIENYTNKNINIHSICKDINSDITSFMHLIDKIKISKILLKTISDKSVYPDQWHNTIIIPISKSQKKKNKFNIIKYRPISLINTITKTAEMVNKQPCGFRKNHSTIDLLTTLHTDICNKKHFTWYGKIESSKSFKSVA
ncbi:hypothetical protein AGLY_006381 [Aphis glycines]|uniref:Reverse transcriptase domain-containing protein n=1 Tax=Aphis glycines TaxID=307491 RepID=A0A6G0TS55_APHGL|nr:hypothetical protein AGLY_006381 [Aphis glycines]